MFGQLSYDQSIYNAMSIPRRIQIPFLILALLFAGACGGPSGGPGDTRIVENPYEAAAQDEGSPVEFVLDGSFGVEDAPEDAILDNVRGTSVDAAGNVYILDGMNRIVSFDPSGSIRWQMNAQGEGPGELNRPWGMVMGKDELLYVNNQSSTRIDVFNLRGEHVRELSPESFGHQRFSLIGFPDDSTAVGTVFQPGTLGTRIVVVNAGMDWSVRNEFVIDQAEGLDIPDGLSGSPGVELYDGSLAVGNVRRYEISLLSLAGDTLRIIRRDVPDYTRPGFHRSGNSISMRFFSNVTGPINLSTGHRLVQASWPSNVDDPDAFTAAGMSDNPPEIDYHRTLDVYDADWTLIYSIEGDEYQDLALGSPQPIDAHGVLFASRSTPWPRLDRYTVQSAIQ